MIGIQGIFEGELTCGIVRKWKRTRGKNISRGLPIRGWELNIQSDTAMVQDYSVTTQLRVSAKDLPDFENSYENHNSFVCFTLKIS